MDLAVIGDFNFKKIFDEVIPAENYFLAKIGEKQCVFFNNNDDFINNLEITKKIGAIKILEITNSKLDEKRANIAENMGLAYSGFLVTGKDEYIKPLIQVAMESEKKKANIGLTEREYEVLSLLGNGMSNKEIARKLFLSEKTVKNHLNSIFKKIDVNDRTNAALYAVKNNIG